MWGATAFSSGAFWLQQVIIGWLAYELTESAFLTTLAMGLDALPILIVGPVGGLLADSWDRRKLLAGMLAYQCLATAVFGRGGDARAPGNGGTYSPTSSRWGSRSSSWTRRA